MDRNRRFTDHELEMMGRPRLDRALAAVEAGEKEQAVREIKAMYKEFLSMHDLLRDWIAGLNSHLYKKYGDEALYEATHEVYASGMKMLAEAYHQVDPPRQVKMLAAGYRGHFVPLKVEEDEEKFTVTMLPCGSGGKLALEGGYDPPRNLSRVKKPQPQTFGLENFPVYCTHCAFQEIIPIEEFGHPIFITDCPEGDKIGREPCRVYIYKNKKDIPERFYRRLGKEKPVTERK